MIPPIFQPKTYSRYTLVISVEGIGWKSLLNRDPKFYVEVEPGESKRPISTKEVGIVNNSCTWQEKIPL